MRRGAVGAFAAVFLLLVAAGSASSASTASHVTPRWRATLAKLPANAAIYYQHVGISSISCSSPGNCTAVGSYVRHGQHYEGLLLTEKAGHWATGVEAVLPANAASYPQVDLTSVSCASAGTCTAVGTYNDGSGGIYSEGGTSGLLLSERAGHWARGVEAALPADAGSDPLVSLHVVSCASAGNCTAVGSYYDSAGDQEGLLLTEKAGHWKRGVAYGEPNADINSVSCSSDGSCSAVGYDNGHSYRDSGGPFGDALLLTKKGGKWQRVGVSWPDGGPGEGATLTAVSCASAGNCGAVGEYNIGIDEQQGPLGVLLTETAGTWGRGVTAMPPTNANDPYYGDYVDLEGISCASAGDCSAIGTYYVDDYSEWLTLLTEKAGKWRRGVEAALPESVPEPPYGAAISCGSPGNCTAAADYYNPDYNGYSGSLLMEIAGRWARGIRPPGDVPGAPSFDNLSSVSCASPGKCGAVGGDPNRDHGVLLDSTTKPCVVPELSGKTLPGARHSIESHGCSVGTIEHAPSRTIETGRVISQAPQPGRHHRVPWTKVDLVVSSGP